MHVTSPVTVTISVTQKLCQCAPKLNHVSSILYEALNKKKIKGFSLPSFILIINIHHL